MTKNLEQVTEHQTVNDLQTLIPETKDITEVVTEGVDFLDQAVVLESGEWPVDYRKIPVSVLCPGCGDVIAQLPSGLPDRLAYFNEYCSECETDLRRWSVVVINTACESFPAIEELKTITTDYWNRHLWNGIVTTPDEYPRMDEYTRAYEEKAQAFGWDWQVTCPLCRQSLDEIGVSRLDYHHWRHTPDEGICLCRNCHKALSGGQTDRKQDWSGQQFGVKDKHDLQLTRLALREQAVAKHDGIPELVKTIHDRYNLIQDPETIRDVLTQTLQSEEILGHLNDNYLLNM